MTRSIDADELEEFFKGITITNTGRTRGEAIRAVYISEVLKAVYNGVMNLPTIDAVSVVRCRDCIFHKEKRCTVWRERAVIVECYTDDDGYCYKGERREHETD